MPQYCCVPQCTSRHGGHRFPSDPELHLKWRIAVNRVDELTKKLWMPRPHDKVCRNHFLPDDYRERTLRRERAWLKKHVVPSVFMYTSGPKTRRRGKKTFIMPATTHSWMDGNDKDLNTAKYIEIVPLDNCSNSSPNVKCDPFDFKVEEAGHDTEQNDAFDITENSNNIDSLCFMPAEPKVKAEVDKHIEQYKMHDVDCGNGTVISNVVIPAFYQTTTEGAQSTSCQLSNTAVPFVWCKTPEDDVPSVSDECRQQMNALSSAMCVSALISSVHDGENVDNMKDSDDVSRHSDDVVGETFSWIGETVRVQRMEDVTQDKMLSESKRMHRSEKMCMCCTCHKAFLRPSGFIKQELADSEGQPDICDSCHNIYGRLSDREARKLTHTYVCNICLQAFYAVTDLAQHKLLHTYSHPYIYKCEICQKRFTQLGTLKTHKLTHINRIVSAGVCPSMSVCLSVQKLPKILGRS